MVVVVVAVEPAVRTRRKTSSRGSCFCGLMPSRAVNPVLDLNSMLVFREVASSFVRPRFWFCPVGFPHCASQSLSHRLSLWWLLVY